MQNIAALLILRYLEKSKEVSKPNINSDPSFYFFISHVRLIRDAQAFQVIIKIEMA